MCGIQVWGLNRLSSSKLKDLEFTWEFRCRVRKKSPLDPSQGRNLMLFLLYIASGLLGLESGGHQALKNYLWLVQGFISHSCVEVRKSAGKCVEMSSKEERGLGSQ